MSITLIGKTGSRVGGKWIMLEVMSGQGWVIHTANICAIVLLKYM